MFVFQQLFKYLVEGLGVALAVYLVPYNQLQLNEIVLIALIAAATFALLDQFSPGIGYGVRYGSGFGIGYRQVGMGGVVGMEGYQEL